jgi:Na+/proline symporter
MTDDASGPIDPRLDRYRPVTRALRWAVVVVAVFSAGAVLSPDPVGEWFGVALVTVLIGAPLVRVLWFVVRWFRRGDPRYAAVGIGVLMVIAIGTLLALLGV